MKRRDFLKNSSAVTLMLSSGAVTFSKRARAQNAPKFFLSFAAAGAWDMTRLADPHGENVHSRHYNNSDIMSVSGTDITYAPESVSGGTPEPFRVGAGGDDFFVKYGPEMVVFRGVDMQTNSHDVGPRHMFSGNIRVGNPNFGALVAAIHEQENNVTLPMTFLSTGGFDDTRQLLPPARVGNINAFKDLAQPFRVSATSATNMARYAPAEVEAQLKAKELERAARRAGINVMPQVGSAMEALERARTAEPGFDALFTEFSNLPELTPSQASNPLIPKAQIAIAAFKAGQCVAANLHHGSFDTHSNHDALHPVKMGELLEAIDYTIDTLKAEGLWSETLLFMGSDFSRTTFNDDDGKDHWPITHAMVIGQGIGGGRVIGATDNGAKGDGTFVKGPRAQKVIVQGGEVVVAADQNNPAAGFLQPTDIMRALRFQYGIDSHPLSQRFAIGDGAFSDLLPIF